jgi:subtilisin family serine protease
MLDHRRIALRIACLLTLLLATFAYSQSGEKKKVNSQADLPRFSYPLAAPASKLVQADDATFNAFAGKVRTDLDTIFRDYAIDDKATLRTLLSVKLDLQQLAGEDQPALQTIDTLRSLQEKPAAKLVALLYPQAMLQAAVDTHTTRGPAYVEAFVKHYSEAVDPLPWDVVQDDMNSSYAGSRLYTKAVAIANVMTDLDPAVQKSGALDNQEAWELISTRNDLQSWIPLLPARGQVLKQYIAAHNMMKPDIWAAREVALTKDQNLPSVLVAIWDSGIDVSVFPNQLFTDSKPTASGTHGLAFDDRGGPSTSWLYPLTPEQQKENPEFLQLRQGRLDIENGIDSPAADAAQKRFNTLSPEQIHQLFELDEWLGFYVHGTHCAGIAVRGNAAARLVVARFNDALPELPFAPTAEWAHHLGTDFQQMSDYFRTRNVRVVNMSWGDEPQEFETWISKTGGGADPAERKKRAAELYAIWRAAIESAIKNAPNTLFVTAAGNSDSDSGFIDDVPASLHLPNLIAVGAVNQAGDETSFTSYGSTVVVDADGYNVESYVPGGAKLRLSGTSMASPNVVNLAAKLLALNPALNPAQVIELIRQGATISEDGRRHLIDEKRSVALLQANK